MKRAAKGKCIVRPSPTKDGTHTSKATAAMNNSLQAQVTALKAYYGLLIDAHLIWDMDHD